MQKRRHAFSTMGRENALHTDTSSASSPEGIPLVPSHATSHAERQTSHVGSKVVWWREFPILRESRVVVVLLLLATTIRLILAGLGWPQADSDEATMGLMADDILWHGAHPIFLYGQNYMGAFQAYLAAPIFAILGPTNFALRVTATLEVLLFLLILYLLTRAVFSPVVATWTLLLLALGPYEALFFDLRAGAGTQDTLLLGTALFGLTYLRLRYGMGDRRPMHVNGHEAPHRGRLALLDLGIGVIAGLSLWAHLLTVPFILTAILALIAQRASQLFTHGSSQPHAEPVAVGAHHVLFGGEETNGWLDSRPLDPSPPQLTRPTYLTETPGTYNQWRKGRILTETFVQIALFVVGFVLAAFPFILANIASDGATFRQTFGVAGPGSTPHPGLLGHLLSLGQQIAATLLVGLPHLFDETLICPSCVLWPRPYLVVTKGQILQEMFIALPLSLTVIALWCVNAGALVPAPWKSGLSLRVLARVARQPMMSRAKMQKTARVPNTETVDHTREERASGQTVERPILSTQSWYTVLLHDAEWWGRVLFVVGSALVLLEYVASRASYASPGTSARYLIGLYAFTPLVVAPLIRWSQPLRDNWRRQRGDELWQLTTGGHKDTHEMPSVPSATHRQLSALLVTALLAVLVLLNVAGVAKTLSLTHDRTLYGVPAGSRDMQVIDFLLTHHGTRFYTTYWTCDRLMFAAAEQVICGVISDHDVFRNGFNRIIADKALLAATPHPAYVFDPSDSHAASALPNQVERAIASGDPRFTGYVGVSVAGFRVYYYVDAT